MRARTLIECLADPLRPAHEISDFISLMLQGRSVREQKDILEGAKDNITKALEEINQKS